MVQSIVLWIDAAVTPLYCSNGHYPESSATVYVRDNSSNFRDFSAIAQTIIKSQSRTKQTKNKKLLTKSITRLIYSSVSSIYLFIFYSLSRVGSQPSPDLLLQLRQLQLIQSM